MPYRLLKSFFLFFLMTLAVQGYTQTHTAKSIIQKMITASEGVKTARYSLKKQERIESEMIESAMNAKLQNSPYKVYVYNIKPTSGSEVLFSAGENNGNALVNPNSFPYVNLNLNPNNSLLRKEQHHTLNDLGFNYITNIIKNQVKKEGEKFFGYLTYDGEVEWSGKKMYKITLDNKNFAYVNYTVLKGETITTIAKKLNVSDYMILAANPKVGFYDDVKTNQVIKVPNSYARKIVLYIDKTNYLPLGQFIYDEKGLYEKYEMHNFILNPVFRSDEFSPDNKEYHF